MGNPSQVASVKCKPKNKGLCRSDTCKNGGTCLLTPAGDDFKCVCADCWEGSRCEDPTITTQTQAGPLCPRPMFQAGPWCTPTSGSTAIYSLKDCDGDGILDHFCQLLSLGQTWIINGKGENGICLDGKVWGQGPNAACN